MLHSLDKGQFNKIITNNMQYLIDSITEQRATKRAKRSKAIRAALVVSCQFLALALAMSLLYVLSVGLTLAFNPQ
jgi:hypothetical protein